jgi:hypothetical protein
METVDRIGGFGIEALRKKGLPNLLQLALFAREFEDVMYLTSPPRVVQKVLFGVLAPIARLLGYKGSYPRYLERGPSGRVEVEPWSGPTEPVGGTL